MNVFCRLILISSSALSLTACDPELQDIRIVAQEFRFVPAEVRLDAYRPVRLTIVNEGRQPHNFTSTVLANPQVRILSKAEPAEYREADTLKIPPGRSATITLNVPPGLYVFYCKLHGHSGMVGALMAR